MTSSALRVPPAAPASQSRPVADLRRQMERHQAWAGRPSRQHDHDDRDEVRQAFALSTPYRAAELLGLRLVPPARPHARSVAVWCPWHSEATPGACSLTIRRGQLQAKCHSCGESGDVLSIVAAIEGLDLGPSFGEVLARAAALVGVEVRQAGRRAPAAAPPNPLRARLRAAEEEARRLAVELRTVREELALERAHRAEREDAARAAIAEAETLHRHAGLLRGTLDAAADRAVLAEARLATVRTLLPRVAGATRRSGLAALVDELEAAIGDGK